MVRLFFLLSFFLLSACSSFIFYPTKTLYLDPVKMETQLQIKIEDVYFTSQDGTPLHAWYLPNQTKQLKGTIMFLHGNAENISSHITLVWWLPLTGYNVFMPDYRGYGSSEGTPTLEGVHMDIQSAMATLLARKDIGQNVILYGQSLGGALAITNLVDSPYRDRFKALLVEGSFTSYRTVAREVLDDFWLTWLFQWPLSLAVRDDYRPIDAIARVSPIPVLIVHGDQDQVIRPHHSQKLYKAAKQPKSYWLMKGGRHNVFNNSDARDRLLDYFDKVLNIKKK